MTVNLEEAREILTRSIDDAIELGYTIAPDVTFFHGKCCAIGAIGASRGFGDNQGFEAFARMAGISQSDAIDITLGFDNLSAGTRGHSVWYQLGLELRNKYVKE